MPRLCQSSCINHKPQAGWPALHILEELHAHNITVTAGLNHEELFKYCLIQEHSIDAQHWSVVTQTAVLPKGKSKVPPENRTSKGNQLSVSLTPQYINEKNYAITSITHTTRDHLQQLWRYLSGPCFLLTSYPTEPWELRGIILF